MVSSRVYVTMLLTMAVTLGSDAAALPPTCQGQSEDCDSERFETDDVGLIAVHKAKSTFMPNLDLMPDLEPAPTPAPAAPCPYDFTPPNCPDAECQTPRDLTPGAEGTRTPTVPTLTPEQVDFMPQTNVHFHLGAEHKSKSYSDASVTETWEAANDTGTTRPGFMCATSNLTAKQLQPYKFKYCKDVAVGTSYEVHYVHSSAGTSGEIADGLGGAANGRGLLNPLIAVQAQIYQIVQGAKYIEDMVHGWTVTEHEHNVLYPGSTTGTSFNNKICSPYFISWHVDLQCHQVSPEAFDNMCKTMKKDYGMESDLHPHGSRELVDSAWVVPNKFVIPFKYSPLIR